MDRPEIDLDANIREARATIQRAQAALSQARQQAKADRRKKARLIRKACHLSPADLERIAVLKRCGLAGVEPAARGPQDEPAASSNPRCRGESSAGSAACAAGSSSAHNSEEAPSMPVPATTSANITQAPEDVAVATVDVAAPTSPGDDGDMDL